MPPIYKMASRLSEGDRSLNLSATPICVRCYKRGCRNRSDAHRSRPKARCPMTLTATNATDTTLRRRTLNQFIAQPLMVPFPMIMGHTLGYGPSNMALADWNHPNEAFLCDGTDQAFGVGVRVRRPIRRLDDAQPRVLQARADRLTPFRVAARPARSQRPCRT
jgi:hypothetical protein